MLTHDSPSEPPKIMLLSVFFFVCCILCTACASAFVGTPVTTRASLKPSVVTMSASDSMGSLSRGDAIKVGLTCIVALPRSPMAP